MTLVQKVKIEVQQRQSALQGERKSIRALFENSPTVNHNSKGSFSGNFYEPTSAL